MTTSLPAIVPILVNGLMILLCVAVLIQSRRMLRGMRDLKASGLAEVVQSLDRATTEARAVLTELRVTLGSDVTANRQCVADGIALREELTMMTDMANASAERILAAVREAGAARAGLAGSASDEVTGEDEMIR